MANCCLVPVIEGHAQCPMPPDAMRKCCKFGSNFIPPSLFVILLHLTQNGHSTPHNTHIDRGWDVGLRVLTLVG